MPFHRSLLGQVKMELHLKRYVAFSVLTLDNLPGLTIGVDFGQSDQLPSTNKFSSNITCGLSSMSFLEAQLQVDDLHAHPSNWTAGTSVGGSKHIDSVRCTWGRW